MNWLLLILTIFSFSPQDKGLAWLVRHQREMGDKGNVVYMGTMQKVWGEGVVKLVLDKVVAEKRKVIKMKDGCMEESESYQNMPTSSQTLVWLYKESLRGRNRSREYTVVRNQLKERWSGNENDIYGLTHIILTKSDYYSQYLKIEEYAWEVEKLNELASKLAQQDKWSNVELDTASEVVISLKLLTIKPTENMQKLVEKIKDRQNDDGSWGDSTTRIGDQIHHTVVATVALQPFPITFSGGNIYCWK